jgi:hypothetical protein
MTCSTDASSAEPRALLKTMHATAMTFWSNGRTPKGDTWEVQKLFWNFKKKKIRKV